MKEVICIDTDFGYVESSNSSRWIGDKPSKYPILGQTYTVIDQDVHKGILFYNIAELNDTMNNWWQAENFADTTNLSKEIAQALKAPSPDYRPEKLSPEEQELFYPEKEHTGREFCRPLKRK